MKIWTHEHKIKQDLLYVRIDTLLHSIPLYFGHKGVPLLWYCVCYPNIVHISTNIFLQLKELDGDKELKAKSLGSVNSDVSKGGDPQDSLTARLEREIQEQENLLASYQVRQREKYIIYILAWIRQTEKYIIYILAWIDRMIYYLVIRLDKQKKYIIYILAWIDWSIS